jgi:hypothetical protein
MDNLYIRIENNQAVDHPATGENLISAFGEIPSNWAPFKRIHPENSEHYDNITDYHNHVCTYELDDDGITWKDVWSLEDKSEEELKKLEEDRIKGDFLHRQIMLTQVIPNASGEEKLRLEFADRVLHKKMLDYLNNQ